MQKLLPCCRAGRNSCPPNNELKAFKQSSFKWLRLSIILFIAAFVYSIPAKAQALAAVWTGSANTNWNNPGNWAGASLPSIAGNVVVPSSTPFSPVIYSGMVSVNNLELQGGAMLDISNCSFTLNGVFSGAGSFIASPASSFIIGGTIGGSAGTIRFASAGNNIGSLMVNRTGAASTVTLGSPLLVTNVFTVAAGTFYTMDLLTLKSDVGGTARVGASAGVIVGKVTVEQYIPARRAWRMICSSISATGAPLINASWQEGAVASTDNYMPGFGTHITGGPTSKGFDKSPTNSSSIKYMYGSTWTDLANTNATAITRYPGYLMFIRGNRSYDIGSTLSTTAPLTTILRAKGNLNQGTLPAVSIAASGLTMVANPYASPVSFAAIAASSINVKNRLYVWDPALGGAGGVGGYVVFDWNGAGYTAVPASSMSSVIKAGQPFFVESNNGTGTGRVFINESHKTTGETVAQDKVSSIGIGLTINLKIFNDDRSTAIIDGVMSLFDNTYSNAVDKEDALKVDNLSDNLSIAATNGKQLTIERRTMPTAADTLWLNINSLRKSEYQLELLPLNFVRTGSSALLYDKFTNTLFPLSSIDTSRYTFTVSSNTLSQQANRFSIVYRDATAILSAIEGKVTGPASIDLDWKVINGQSVLQYEVEKYLNGVFKLIGTVKGGEASINAYHFADEEATTGDNIYRIKAVGFNGNIVYSSTLKFSFKQRDRSSDEFYFMPVNGIPLQSAQAKRGTTGKPVTHLNTRGVSVYPNPVQGRTMVLSLSEMEKGEYHVEMINQAGQTVYQSRFSYQGGSTQAININKTLPSGAYTLNVQYGAASYKTKVLVKN